MSIENAIRAIKALECLSKLMDLYNEFDEEPKVKKRKVYVKAEDVERQLLKDIAWKDTASDDSFCPLSMDNFEELYNMVSSKVNRKSLVVASLSLRLRLAITLRYLIAGDSYRTLEKCAYISRKSLQKIIPEMLKLLIDILEKEYLKYPKTEKEWINEVTDFETFWDFPHTLGALDIRNFRSRISTTENPTKSLLMLSVLDSHSRFQHVEIFEREEDKYDTAYINSKLYASLRSKTLKFPPDSCLKGQTDKTPYFFVGTEVFGVDRYVLNAYDEVPKITRSEKAFNFRLNRVRLAVQMAFEIMFFRFKIFNRLNEIHIEKAKLIVKICCILHNYLTQKLTQPLDYNEEAIKLEAPVSDIPLPKQIHKLYEIGIKTRNNVCNYCVNEGNISEQWQKILAN